MSEIDVRQLLRPFEYNAHKWRVMNITKAKDKGTVAFYIDARDVMDRLDAIVGPQNWSDSYNPLVMTPEKWAVECTLTVCGVSKSDIGEGDAPKDAYSDALKRAAVKHGIGRYLYGMDTGKWFAVNEWKEFTPESIKAIESLLRQNLTRLGVKTPTQNGGATGNGGVTTTTKQQPEHDNPFTSDENANSGATESARITFVQTTEGVFGKKDSTDARHWFIRQLTQKLTPGSVRDSSIDLTLEELRQFTSNLAKNKDVYAAKWTEHKAAQHQPVAA